MSAHLHRLGKGREGGREGGMEGGREGKAKIRGEESGRREGEDLRESVLGHFQSLLLTMYYNHIVATCT